jgi:hypothetical protein
MEGGVLLLITRTPSFTDILTGSHFVLKSEKYHIPGRLVMARVYNRGEEREYRTWIFKMLSKSRAPGIDPTGDVFRRAYIYTAVGHVTLHFEF